MCPWVCKHHSLLACTPCWLVDIASSLSSTFLHLLMSQSLYFLQNITLFSLLFLFVSRRLGPPLHIVMKASLYCPYRQIGNRSFFFQLLRFQARVTLCLSFHDMQSSTRNLPSLGFVLCTGVDASSQLLHPPIHSSVFNTSYVNYSFNDFSSL